MLRWSLFYKDNTNLPRDSKVGLYHKQLNLNRLLKSFKTKILDTNLPVHLITDKEINDFCNQDTTNKFKVIWIGHATSLVNFENTIILMDPVFSERLLSALHLTFTLMLLKMYVKFTELRQTK